MKQILLIEDSAVAQKVAELNFGSEDCELDITVSAMEAIEALSKKKYDVIIVDIGLPDLDGYQLVQRIRQSGNSLFTIVGLSAHIGVEYEQRCLESGIDHFFSKPLNHKIVKKIMNF